MDDDAAVNGMAETAGRAGERVAARACAGGRVSTVRVTAAQAVVRYLANQYVADPAGEARFFAGVWAIFGHGNVAGLGEALHAAPGRASHLSSA